MEYRDSTAISKVYMKRVDLRARPEGGRVFSLAPRRLDSFAVASNMFTTGLRSLSVRRFFRCCHAVCSCQLTAERFNCKLCSVESRNRYRHVTIRCGIVAPRYIAIYRYLFDTGSETLVLTILVEVSTVSHNTSL